jgi:hypothetical protein
MNMQQRHAAWIGSTDLQRGHAAGPCSMDMQHGQDRQQRQAARAYSIGMQQGMPQGHAV